MSAKIVIWKMIYGRVRALMHENNVCHGMCTAEGWVCRRSSSSSSVVETIKIVECAITAIMKMRVLKTAIYCEYMSLYWRIIGGIRRGVDASEIHARISLLIRFFWHAFAHEDKQDVTHHVCVPFSWEHMPKRISGGVNWDSLECHSEKMDGGLENSEGFLLGYMYFRIGISFSWMWENRGNYASNGDPWVPIGQEVWVLWFFEQ